MKRKRTPGRSAAAPAPAAAGPRLGSWLLRHPWVFVVLAGLIAFGGALGNRFTYDDRMVIEEAEPLLRDLPLLSTVLSRDYFLTSHESTYRPVVTLSYALDYALGGLTPVGYHAQSVLWHLGCALLVYALARRLLPRAGRGVALVAGLLFAVHPALTEAIDNASFREDPLATFFTLLALLLALRNTRAALWGALASYLVALFAKESALVMPLLLAGARWSLPAEERDRWDRRAELGGFVAVSLVFVVVRFVVMTSGPDYGEHPGGTLFATLLGTPPIFARYLRLLVLPWPLCADYSGVFDFPPRALPLVLSVLALAAYLALTVWLWRRHRLAAFGLAWFLVALGPVSNLIAIPVPAAERFLYLPLAGIALAAAAGAGALAPRVAGRARTLATLGGLVALIALATASNLRHPAWRDNHALWSRTARDFPRSWGAHHGLGVELKEHGELARAAAELEQALGSRPTRSARALIVNDLGIVYGMQGRLDESARMLRRALDDAPHAKTWLNLGITLARSGDTAGAAAAYQEAIRKNPLYARAHAMLATLRLGQGALAEAEAHLEKAARISPRDPAVQQARDALARARARAAPPGPGPGPAPPGAP
ncbi:MAG TPA: tetratricopeptide repeat protein [Polyangia bacterium]|jgi:tetratricopeptide (TPR) repeat protein